MVNDTKKLLGGYPNTYTFTKAMCERIMQKRKGNTPLTIVRPSIIGASEAEPFPGWVDTVSAAGAIYFLCGLGILNYVQGDMKKIGDQIPVDYVSDCIIAAAACFANSNELNIVHSSSSTKNPITWKLAGECVVQHFRNNPPEKQLSKPWFLMYPSQKWLKSMQVARRMSASAYTMVAKALNSSSMQKKAVQLQKVITRSESVAESFKHFTMNEWFFACDQVRVLQDFCSPEELEMFALDVTKIEWRKYIVNFCWGLQRYLLKEMVEPPSQAKSMNLLEKSKFYLNDIQWAMNKGSPFHPRSNEDMKSCVMNSQRVQDLIQKLSREKKDKLMTEEQYKKKLQKNASYLCESMFATYSMPVIRLMAVCMNQILKSMYDKIVIDETALKRFNDLDQKQSGPIVLMPTHRSYMDFLLVSYIFFANGLKCPHIAAAEDFLSIRVIHKLLRSSGAFFIRRKEIEHMDLYKAILYEYIQRLLLDQSWFEFFIEGTRSRAGKMLTPKFGLLNIVTDTFFDKKLPDVQLVPVTINYEKIVEGETFPFELLGESKVKESLVRVVKAASILNQNFGRVYIEFAEPMSLKDYTQKYKQKAISNQNSSTQSRW